MTIESSQCELSIVSGKVQLQIQTAHTKQVTVKKEQVKGPLLEKLRFCLKFIHKSDPFAEIE